MNNTLLLPVTVVAIFVAPVVVLGGPPLVTDDTGVLASGIEAIKFDFLATDGNGSSVYREIDVLGSAAVPEPTTTALLGLGGLALILRRRK